MTAVRVRRMACTALLVACSASWFAIAEAETPAPDDAVPLANLAPLEMAKQIPLRLQTDLFREVVPVRVASAGERAAAATHVLDELFAPLRDPACQALLPSATRDGRPFTAHFPATDPAAVSSGDAALLVPDSLPPLTRVDADTLQAKGVLPFELMLAGEWARAVAARHAGPAPADPLLRQARAARLEGVARLAGIALSVQAAGISVSDLGSRVLDADADEAGWPRAALAEGASSRLDAAFLRVLTEDGLRWAAYHFLLGGIDGLIAALERPVVGPADLLTPGRRRDAVRLPGSGCRVGPRPAALLLVDDDDTLWVDALQDDLWRIDGREVVVQLVFDGENDAKRAEAEATARGWRCSRQGTRLEGRRAR